MNKRTIVKNAVMYLVITLLLLPSIAAFGISPGKRIIDFIPNTKAVGEITIFNTEGRQLNLEIIPTGELASFTTVKEPVLTLAPEQSKTVVYEIQFPANLERSGMYTSALVIKEILSQPSQGRENEVAVRALAGVASIIEVHAPYNGKIIDALFFIPPIDPYQPVLIRVQVMNVGDKPIKKIRFTAALTDREGQRVVILQSDEKKLAPRERADLLATWDPQVAYGEYHATLTLFHDGKKQETATDIIIGRFLLEPTSLAVENFVFNQEATLVVDIKNNGDETILGTLEMSITDRKSYNQHLEPTTLELAPAAIQQVRQQWNIQGLAPGKYYGTIILGANGRTSERNFIITLSEQGIETAFESFNQLTGTSILLSPADKLSSGSSLTPVLLLSLVALFLLARFVYLLKHKNPA